MAKNHRYRYVEDYETIPYVGANGRSKQKVRYIGSYQCFSESDETLRPKLILLHILSYLAVVWTVAPLFFRHSAYQTMYVAVTNVLALFPSLYLLMGSFRLPWRKKPMRRDEFEKGFDRIRHSAVGILIVLGATLVGEIVFWCLNRVPFRAMDAVFIACIVLSEVTSFLIYNIGKRIQVEKKPNDFVEQKLF